MQTVDVFPDIEIMMISAMAPLFPDYRFTSTLPAILPSVAVRFKRISGASRDIRIDRPIVDTDTFTSDYGTSSLVSRQVHAAMLSLRGVALLTGVVQSVISVEGPRWLADPNQSLTRFGATVELHIHV